MPIPLSQLERDSLIPRVLSASATIAELLHLIAEQPQPHWALAVIRVGADAYDVLTLDDLGEATMQYGLALPPMALGVVPDLLKPAASVRQDKVGEDTARGRQANTPRRRLVVLDAEGAVLGVLASTNLGVIKGLLNPLDLIGDAAPGILAPAYLNTRFDGIGPNEPLTVGRRVPLIVSVGMPTATNAGQSSRPFAFDFTGASGPVAFVVHVDADQETWTIKAVEPKLIVARPGVTRQEAEFLVTARQPGRDKLHISVERADTGATIQHLWLPVIAQEQGADRAFVPVAQEHKAAGAPLDATSIGRRGVEITIQPGVESFAAVVRADLPGGVVRETYTVPVSGAEIQNATLRLRQELEKLVLYEVQEDGWPVRPFARPTVDERLAREKIAPLADAGEQVWRMLFGAARAPEGLKRLAADIRDMPHGSTLQVVLDSQQFIVPWALLYDKPGPINAETLDWAGFWGYRYILDVLPPGRYPDPLIVDSPPGVQLFFNDDYQLGKFAGEQQTLIERQLGEVSARVVRGHTAAEQALAGQNDAALIYFYCHGDHRSGAVTARALASESAIYFSDGRPLRLADLRRLPAAALPRRPLVFLNACEGATQDAFYYDGFMPYFIEELGARGFIGTEVKVPQSVAHNIALRFLRAFAEGRPVGEILWRLRQEDLGTRHNILAFNYSLYCLAEVRLAKPTLADLTPAAGPPPSR